MDPRKTFLNLPLDLLFEIALYLSQSSLANLCRTSHLSRSLFTRSLYRSVDLVDSKGSASLNPDTDGEPFGAISESGRKNRLSLVARSRQKVFVSALLLHPVYALSIRSLTIAPFILGLGEIEMEEKRLHEIRPPLMDSTWQKFSGLVHLQHLELCHSYDQPTLDVPPSLKPPSTPIFSLRTLVIRCQATPRFVDLLLDSLNPVNLTSLELDNVRQETMARAYPAVEPRGTNGIAGSLSDHSSPFTSLFVRLTDKCPSLRRLQFRKIGPIRYRSKRVGAADRGLYKDCATFITSIQSTLQEFVFEQVLEQRELDSGPGASTGDYLGTWRDEHWMEANGRLMDLRFCIILLPLLLENDWKALRRLEIRGVEGRVGVGLEDKLRDALLSTVEILVELPSV